MAQVEFGEALGQEEHTVLFGDGLEGRRETAFAAMHPKEFPPPGVECHHPKRFVRAPDELLRARSKLVSGASVERERHNLPGRHALLDEPGQATTEHAGLAGPGTGENKQRPPIVSDGARLIRRQIGEHPRMILDG